MIKIFIVDDHEIIRQGLKMVLIEEKDIQIVGEAQDGKEAIEKLKKIDCDIILLDMNMPGRSGIELLGDIKGLFPKRHILVLSIHPEDKFALRALKTGASGYLCKDIALEELVTAIHKIHEKGRYISTTLAEQLAFDLIPSPDKMAFEALSQRENEIMLRLCKGEKVKDIAATLELSISTVFTYRMRIFEKLNVKNNVELTHYALDNHLI